MTRNLPPVISLYSETMQSGKSELARYLVNQHGYTRLKFAGPLKEMASGLFRGMGFDEETVRRMLEGDLKEEPIPGLVTSTPRHVFQTLGTNWGREAIEQDLWTKIAKQKAAQIISEGGRVVVDDTRFPNELETLRSFPGCLAVYIERPGAPFSDGHGIYEGLLKKEDHDVVLLNDSSLATLRQASDLMLAAVSAGAENF